MKYLFSYANHNDGRRKKNSSVCRITKKKNQTQSPTEFHELLNNRLL